MKTLLKNILAIIVATLISWPLVAFIKLDFNFYNYDENGRAGLALLVIFLFLMYKALKSLES